MIDDDEERERSADAATGPGPAPSWRGWLLEAGRSLFFRRPRWERVLVEPLPLLALFVLRVALTLGVQYAAFDGPLIFYWQAVAGGWLVPLLMLGASWVVVRTRPGAARPEAARGVAALFGTLVAQGFWLQGLLTIPVLAILAATSAVSPEARQTVFMALWYGGSAWAFLAGTWLLGRQAFDRLGWAAAVAAMALAPVLQVWAPGAYFWYPQARPSVPVDGEAEPEGPAPFILTQEVAEAQSAALVAALDAVQPQRRGIVDLYAITFAPYADEDVFSREAGMVGRVMAERFDARGRVLQLQNHASTAATVPWATPLNLRRAIDRAAQLMDRDDDILFIHLTSHGARDGDLAAEFGPLTVDHVTPQHLKEWLDEAGVRFRVISVSACYSGSWVQPLSGPGTLVMTAADAEHTSYGCGRKSELTFFGRAMYDEQLRQTLSFESAHAVARAVIERREKEAGKTDGYSNPQIYVGSDIRAQLSKLESRLTQQQQPQPAAPGASASAPRR